MDCGSTVATSPDATNVVHTSQAIFTSIPSPISRGYRLVACGADLSAQEKREITQRSPSHGNLLAVEPGGFGLLSYSLSSGRQCVGLTRPAGAEHTARGGSRVHTHMAILSPSDFLRFHCDPCRVIDALRTAVGDEPLLKPLARLPIIELHAVVPTADAPAEIIEAARRLLAALFVRTTRLAVVGIADSFAALRLLMSGAPLALRRRLSLSSGIKLSQARKFDLVFAGSERVSAERAADKREIKLFDCGSEAPSAATPFDRWVAFCKRRWMDGRTAALDRLSVRLDQEPRGDSLSRIASLCDDLDTVASASAAQLAERLRRHRDEPASMPVHADLLREFRVAAESRRSALEGENVEDAPRPAVGGDR